MVGKGAISRRDHGRKCDGEGRRGRRRSRRVLGGRERVKWVEEGTRVLFGRRKTEVWKETGSVFRRVGVGVWIIEGNVIRHELCPFPLGFLRTLHSVLRLFTIVVVVC